MSKIGDLIRNAKELILVPEIYDCSSALAAQINGFNCIMVSSADFACSLTGIPDLQLLSVDEYCMLTERLSNMSDCPVVLDIDAGFGTPLKTYYACKRLARAGAAGVLVTDAQENNIPGKIGDLDLVKLRIKAARDGFVEMGDDDALIIARCDVNPATDFDYCIERCNEYLAAGANMICLAPFGIHTYKGDKKELARRLGEGIKGWIWWPDLTADEKGNPEIELSDLFSFGYKMTGIHYSLHAAMVAMLDCGRHVIKDRNNVHVTKAYDYTGYRFFSPIGYFGLIDQKWEKVIDKYIKPGEKNSARNKRGYFCKQDDCYDPDNPGFGK